MGSTFKIFELAILISITILGGVIIGIEDVPNIFTIAGFVILASGSIGISTVIVLGDKGKI